MAGRMIAAALACFAGCAGTASAQSIASLEPAPVLERPSLLACSVSATQGGAIQCRAKPGADLALDGKPAARASADGVAIIGLARNQRSPAKVTFVTRPDIPTPYDLRIASASVDVLPRKDTVSRFKMACGKISAQTPEEKRHAEVSWIKKDKALKAFSAPQAPLALVKPADGPYSSPYGAVRTYVPETKDCEGSTSVHNGQDIAIATGTEIHAPMAGTVLLADPDLYYEGGAVFLDLGYGLVSVTMHMSRIDVKDGDTVEQGQLLGLSGSTGRVTGPHLHWAIKYRNPLSDDRGTDLWLDPNLMLALVGPGD